MIDGIERVDLLAMIEADGVRLRPVSTRAGEYAGPCPLCSGSERDDRLHVLTKTRAGKQEWFCRKCPTTPKPEAGKMGDAMDYVRIVHRLAGAEAFALLKRYGLPSNGPAAAGSRATAPRPAVLTPEGVRAVDPAQWAEPPSEEWQDAATVHALECWRRLREPAGRDALRYLREVRRLTDETIDRYALGFCDRDDRDAGTWRGITIPVRYAGAMWAMKTRRSSRDMRGPTAPKYLDMRGGVRRAPFNGDALAGQHIRRALVTEGEFDALLAQQHAPADVAVVTWGSMSIAPDHEAAMLLSGRAFDRSIQAFVCFDNDEAGARGAAAWERLGWRVWVPAGSKDISAYAQAGGNVGAWLRAALGDDAHEWDAALQALLPRLGGCAREVTR